MARFAIDLIIVFIFYYLVTLTLEENLAYRQDVFKLILPMIFAAFLVWDGIKLLQVHREVENERRRNGVKNGKIPDKVLTQIYRTGITARYLLAFGFLAIIYQIIYSAQISFAEFHCLLSVTTSGNDILVNGIGIRDPIFILLSFLIVIRYRYEKWKNRDLIWTPSFRHTFGPFEEVLLLII